MKCEACETQNVDGARFCASCGALLPVATTGADPLIGKIIGGRYRVTGVLGEGGMGIVYVGEQQMGSTVRKVAIKTLHPQLSKDPSVLARFHRECGTVAQLEHPNTIKFFDFGTTDDGQLYIAMEFVKGQPLSDAIGGGAISPERVIKIMRQTCGALDEAHNQGIIHRDLKPDNIILAERAGETDFVKVLDFGIAARTESSDAQKEQKLTQQGMVLGTPPYMSPEQFTGKALDARSDIYSLGVIAYEMLTGKLPFEADTPWQWATQHMTTQPTPFEVRAPHVSLPPHMRTAIMRALSKDREQRQASAGKFFTELSAGGRVTQDVLARPTTAAEDASTAAMAAVPDFAAMAAPVSPVAPQHAPGPITPGGVAVPPPPVASSRKSGGKGLVIGLASVGAILVVAIVIVATRGMKKDEDEGLANPFGTSSGSGVASIAPQVDPTETATPPAFDAGSTPTSTVPTSTQKPVTKPSGSGGTASASGGTASTSSTGDKPKGDACDACYAQASAGNISGAARSYAACSNAEGKSACQKAARRGAITSVKSLAKQGKCSEAKAIAAAAESMGAGSSGLSGALGSCK
jgi:eukaryotic-like serine/threonine-protein kinase